ncbi:X2-like carbohydrate binding domain-containing protein [Paenibacillus taichungensis]|uniref:X2-like carbohydrate binding domain-containing protein n=1 Tax=Paenibacillus taichungensis TaxID=484184 RepID=UPI0039A58B7F
MKSRLALITAILMTVTSLIMPGTMKPIHAASSHNFYVSHEGNDDNAGTAESPFRTIEKVKQAVRGINGAMTEDIYVYLQDGEYMLDDTLVFNSEDSGSNGYNIIYTADTGAKPVISGGVDISDGWELYDTEKNIYKRTGVNWNFRQLYIGEDRGIRARQPNLTEADADLQGPYFRAKNGEYPYVIGEDAREWGNILNGTNAEMVVLQSWSQVRGRIDTINTTTGQIDFKFPESGFSYNHHGQGNSPFFFENALSLLDAEGEWFLDTDDQTVYYKPRSNETMNTTRIIAPRLETIVKIEGTEDSKVRNLEFSGLTFKHSNWLAPSSYGYVDVQAGFRYQSVTGGNNTEIRNTARYTAANAMLELKYSGDIRIARNTFQHAGSWGIMGYEGTEHTDITWNTFTQNAGGGIAMGIVGDLWDDDEGQNPSYTLPDGQSQHDSITHNTIDRVALDYGDMVGIGAMLPQHMTIANNEISNLPYSAISIGWNWSDLDHGMTNNQVHNNYLHDSVKLIQDGAGIYTLGRMDGKSNIYHNYIKNMRQGKYAAWNHIMGVYLDGRTSYRMVEQNVIDNTEHAFSGSDHDNIFRHNYYNVDFGNNNASNTAYGNVEVAGSNWPQEALDIIAAAGPGKEPLPAPKEPTNLALMKPVTASSQSKDPAFAVDGDPTTRWAQEEGRADPQWLMVDLGDVYPIASTSTMFELENGYTYKIEYSTDGDVWDMYADKTANVTTQQTNLDLKAVEARYIKITMTHDWGGSIYELSVFPGEGTKLPESNSLLKINEATFEKNPTKQDDIRVKMIFNGGALNGIKLGDTYLVADRDYKLFWDQVIIQKAYLDTLPIGENHLTFDFATGVDPVFKVTVMENDGATVISLNKPAMASSQSLDPALAVDGNPRTRWAQQEGLWHTEGWLMVDLQGVYAIKSVTTMFELSSGYKYKIEYSMDGQNWQTYADRTESETTKQTYQDHHSSEIISRYMRIKALYSMGPSIYEFSVYGVPVGSNSSINLATAAFNKHPNKQDDIIVEMNLQGNTLTGIKNRSLHLKPDTDYTVAGNKVTIHRDYLTKLGEGKNHLTFEFSSGENSLLELNVTDVSGEEINIALSKVVVASSQNKDPLFTVDGDPDTRWAQQEGLTTSQWLKVDLGDVYSISGTKTIFELSSGYKYNIEYSIDGFNWTKYVDKTSVATTEQVNEDRKDAEARYVRLNITDSSGNGASVHEFSVYTVKETTVTDATINPVAVTFDKNPSQQQDVVTNVQLNGNVLKSVNNGNQLLNLNSDYTFAGEKLTVHKSYLASLGIGTATLTLVFDQGNDAKLEVKVMNTQGTGNNGGNSGGNHGSGNGNSAGNPNNGGTESTTKSGNENNGNNGNTEGKSDGEAGGENGVVVPTFSDVANHWAEANIYKAAKLGIVNGYNNGTFKPNRTVTRAEFTVMLMKALKLADSESELSFTDAGKIGSWAQQAVAQAVQAGIVNGYKDGSFRPSASVSRAELAVMVARAGKVKIADVETTGFADDNDIPAWAKSSVFALKEADILKGSSGNKFMPNALATRAEVITIIMNQLSVDQ